MNRSGLKLRYRPGYVAAPDMVTVPSLAEAIANPVPLTGIGFSVHLEPVDGGYKASVTIDPRGLTLEPKDGIGARRANGKIAQDFHIQSGLAARCNGTSRTPNRVALAPLACFPLALISATGEAAACSGFVPAGRTSIHAHSKEHHAGIRASTASLMSQSAQSRPQAVRIPNSLPRSQNRRSAFFIRWLQSNGTWLPENKEVRRRPLTSAHSATNLQFSV